MSALTMVAAGATKKASAPLGPQRTCLGCGRIKSQSSMLRLVLSPEKRLLFDLFRRLPGKGIYFCPQRSCLVKILNGKKLRWAFKKEVDTPTMEDSQKELGMLYRQRIHGLLGIARKHGALISGKDRVIDSLNRGNGCLLILARDLSPRTKTQLRNHRRNIEHLEMGSKDSLGSAIGIAGRGTLLVTDPSLAKRIVEDYHRATSLELELENYRGRK